MSDYFGLTFGTSGTQTEWPDFQEMTWPQIAEMLTTHITGAKEGPCVVPAQFTGLERKKANAARIDIAFLDSDTGATLDDIELALDIKGWQAAVSSTHSHLSTHTRVRLSVWQRFQSENPGASATDFLIHDKGYLPRVASSAFVAKTDADYAYFEHQPCPKFRVALPLAEPWQRNAYATQDEANAAWKERIEALAGALGLEHDQSCTDTSRLFYLPRRPAGGATPETSIMEGTRCDLFKLPRVKPKLKTDSLFKQDEPETSPQLKGWAAKHGARFLIATALKTRSPGMLTGHNASGGKVHIECPNEAAHSQAGRDAATFVCDSGAKGFVIHCRHAHCVERDRLAFLAQMIEQGWLAAADLVDPAFLLPVVPGAEFDTLASDGTECELTEDGVALAFAAANVGKLVYDHTAARWYRWDAARWCHDGTDRTFSDARRFVRDARQRDGRDRGAAGKIAFSAAVERGSRSDPRLAVTQDVWDRDPWTLGVPGGSMDLRTGVLSPPDPALFLQRQTSVAPAAPGTPAPLWTAFLQDATGGAADLQAFLQRLAGYVLTGDVTEECLAFIYGPGGNGKGVFLGALAAIMGEYALSVPIEVFTVDSRINLESHRAQMAGARMVTASETEVGATWAEAQIKQMTGNETKLSARHLYGRPFEYFPQFKLVIVGNHTPRLKSRTPAMERRLRIVPFTNVPANPDPELKEKLRAEYPAILRWAIDGCLTWQAQRLGTCVAIDKATGAYFESQDVFGQWLTDRCEVSPDNSTPPNVLQASFLEYCRANSAPPVSAAAFREMVERAPGLRYVASKGVRTIRGVRLRAACADFQPSGALSDLTIG